jgi:two-component system sensor histidine kinase/response regulator
MSDFVKTILIVDDNPMNVLLTAAILKNSGYETITADSGFKAISLLENSIPSLILLDVMMPDMDGLETCRKIKNNPKWVEIPIIFLTANTQTGEIVDGFNAGGVDYITKPFKNEELLVRVKNHLELSASRKTIIEMNKNRDKLYSIIAHDIRSPLAGIQQTVDAIDQGFFDPASEDFNKIIHQLGIRTRETNTLLNSLLQWTKMQGETIALTPKHTDLFATLSNCILLLEANAKNKDIEINLNVTETTQAWCDEVSIHTVFRNVISNAIKFTPNKGEVNISNGTSGDFTVISIQDTGVGMDEQTVHKVFLEEEFYTTSGTNNEQGTGLGLVMAKDFIKKNKGKLEVTSSPGQGTTISILLPSDFHQQAQ